MCMQSSTNNYFSLFGLEIGFEQDLTRLKERYYQLQKQFHPDNYVSALPQEKMLVEKLAAKINDAYQTLKEPLKRAIYLLEIKGYPLAETQVAMDKAFLQAQFHLRERMGEATETMSLKKEIQSEISAKQNQFVLYCAEKDFERAQNAVREWQFYMKSLTELDEINGTI